MFSELMIKKLNP